MRLLVFVFLIFLLPSAMQAQVPLPTEGEARKELEARGVSQEELKARMLQKGYDLDNIQPEQLPELEQVVEETLNELEKEKNGSEQGNEPQNQTGNNQENNFQGQFDSKQNSPPTKTTVTENNNVSDENVIEAVQEGATVEEAISEEISEKVNEDTPPGSVYGQDIFRNQTLDVYRSADNIKPPDTYILGSGDEIIVSIFGRSQAEFAFTVSEDGFIKPTGVSRIYLRGLTLQKARQLVQKRFSQYYSFTPEQFALTINAARTISVNIFGEVENYGSFTISAINTAFNALVAAGGPTEIGTIRKIKLIRGSETKILDVYDFLFNPNVQYEFFLQDNDIIQVPVSGNIVSIKGEVKRPFRYELIEKEDLVDLIKYAGGLSVNAYLDNIQVNRIINGRRVIVDVNLSSIIANNTGFALENGDEIVVRKVPGRLENYTEIEGAVEFPGKYELSSGMKLTDLLERGNLKEDTRTDVAFLLRKNSDESVRLIKISLDSLQAGTAANLTLQRRDKLLIYSQKDYIDSYKVSVRGAVRQPSTFSYDDGLTLADLINISGGLTADATDFGYITRTNLNNSDLLEYIRVNVKEAAENPNSSANIPLEPRDDILIMSSARFSDEFQVQVSGAVRSPGSFQFAPNLRVRDIVTLSGGLTADATDFGYVTRTNSNNSDLLEYVRINIRAALDNPDSEENIVLEPQDNILIMSSTRFSDEFQIRVAGAVRSPGSFQYAPTLRLQDVLTLAGGLQISAAANRIDIFRVVLNENEPTQTVVATVQVDKNFNIVTGGEISLEPFDIVVVRSVPDFELQSTVTLNGEVKYPGVYALISKDEKLLDIINRAGGLSREAFPLGARLSREKGGIGVVILDLERAIKKPSSRFNYIMKDGDNISIPKSKDLVTINLLGTLAAELYPDKMLTGGRLSVAYVRGKQAEWYLQEYAAGIDRTKKARRRLISVEYPNGQIKRSNALFSTPNVEKGSVINVGLKAEKPKKDKKEKGEPINWNKIVTDTIAIASAVLTVLVLATRL